MLFLLYCAVGLVIPPIPNNMATRVYTHTGIHISIQTTFRLQFIRNDLLLNDDIQSRQQNWAAALFVYYDKSHHE